MCYGNPAKSLEIARSRLTPEQWQRFEREFDDFCVVQGLNEMQLGGSWDYAIARDWAKLALFCGRQREVAQPTADQRVADAKYTRLALAMMDDEQAEQSVERWMGRGK